MAVAVMALMVVAMLVMVMVVMGVVVLIVAVWPAMRVRVLNAAMTVAFADDQLVGQLAHAQERSAARGPSKALGGGRPGPAVVPDDRATRIDLDRRARRGSREGRSPISLYAGNTVR